MNNLVERLRTHLKDYAAAVEAADEIERLHAALRRIAIYDHRWPENAADIARKALRFTQQITQREGK